MALGVEASDGTRKITLEAVTISGAAIDLTAVQIQPILRPYTIFAVCRLVTAAGDTIDLNITWQAVPKLPESPDLGAVIGMGTQGVGL